MAETRDDEETETTRMKPSSNPMLLREWTPAKPMYILYHVTNVRSRLHIYDTDRMEIRVKQLQITCGLVLHMRFALVVVDTSSTLTALHVNKLTTCQI